MAIQTNELSDKWPFGQISWTVIITCNIENILPSEIGRYHSTDRKYKHNTQNRTRVGYCKQCSAFFRRTPYADSPYNRWWDRSLLDFQSLLLKTGITLPHIGVLCSNAYVGKRLTLGWTKCWKKWYGRTRLTKKKAMTSIYPFCINI